MEKGKRTKVPPEFQEFLRGLAEDEMIQDLIKARSFDKAERMLKEKIEKEPDDEKYRYLLGFLYSERGMLRSAVRALSGVLKKDPTNPYAYHLMSVIYVKGNYFRKAEECLEKAVQFAPQDGKMFSTYLDFLVLIKDKKKVRKILKTADKGKLDPHSVSDALNMEADWEKKISDLKRLLKEKPDDAALLLGLAECYYCTFRYREAFRIIRGLIKKRPHDRGIQVAHKSLHYSLKWWYRPKAWFSSTAARTGVPGTEFGIYLLLQVAAAVVIGLIVGPEMGGGVFALFFALSLAYLGGINRMLGVEKAW